MALKDLNANNVIKPRKPVINQCDAAKVAQK